LRVKDRQMQMNRKELEAFAKEAAKGIKTPEDLNDFSRMLKKITVEAALNAEMEEHLGYEKHAKSVVKNSRNSRTSKRIKTEDGEFDLDTPCDRDGSFEPKLVKKNQSRFTSMDEKILWLYAQGMSTREIVQAFDEWYGAEYRQRLYQENYRGQNKVKLKKTIGVRTKLNCKISGAVKYRGQNKVKSNSAIRTHSLIIRVKRFKTLSRQRRCFCLLIYPRMYVRRLFLIFSRAIYRT
jgi:hypothetical protein